MIGLKSLTLIVICMCSSHVGLSTVYSVPIRITWIFGELDVFYHVDDVWRQRVAVAGHVFPGHAERGGGLGLRRGRVRGPRAPEPAQQQRDVSVRAERVPQQQLRRRPVRRAAAGQPGPVLGQHAVPGPAGPDGRPAGPVIA